MGEIKQGDIVVAEYHDLTANQLIVFLAIYTGRDDIALMMVQTWRNDLEFLVRIGLIQHKGFSASVFVTPEGHSYVNNILTVTIEKEIVEKVTIKTNQ